MWLQVLLSPRCPMGIIAFPPEALKNTEELAFIFSSTQMKHVMILKWGLAQMLMKLHLRRTSWEWPSLALDARTREPLPSLIDSVLVQTANGSFDGRIEKNGGCDHMTCLYCSQITMAKFLTFSFVENLIFIGRQPVGCGFDFCWLCLAPYNEILREGNHRHRETCQCVTFSDLHQVFYLFS